MVLAKLARADEYEMASMIRHFLFLYVKLYNHAAVHVEREAVRPSCRKDGDLAEAKTKAAPY
jgi:hypothetical protein